MSIAEVLAELPALTTAERQLVVRQALELDEPPLSPDDEVLLQGRVAEHRADPGSVISLDEMKARLRTRC